MSRKFLTPIVLPADPVAAMEAAPKQYVDLMNEVFIGPTDPGAAYELWVDDDAPWSAPLPAGMGRGYMGIHQLTTAFATTAPHTTYQDSGLTVTFNEETGRFYRITSTHHLYVPGGANSAGVNIVRNGVIVRSWSVPVEALSTIFGHTVTFVGFIAGTTAAGVVYKTMLAARTNGLQVADYGDTAQVRSLVVEDIGGT